MDIEQLINREDLRLERDANWFGRLRLYVKDIEVTQGVQFSGADEHLTDPADRQADNALRLVSDKPAWVRVFVGSLTGGTGLTGTLEVRRRQLGFLWSTVATLTPHGSSMTTVPSLFTTSYAAERGSIGGTLNFVIPASEMIGTLRLVARVQVAGRTAESSLDVAVTLRQTLRLAGVMIAYDGPNSMAAGAPNLTLAAPTVTDLQAMSGTALTLFPVRSTASFRVAASLTQSVPLQSATFPATGCGTAWDALHARVAAVRTADANRAGWIFYGLLPAGTPMGPVGGCGGGGVAVGPVNDPWTLAHEAGHAAGLGHAPSGGAPNADASFPAYEPYDPAATPQGHTGEYGLDVNTGNVMSPATFRDVMGYAWPKWISPYHHGRLVNNAVLNPTTVGIDHLWWHDLVWLEILKLPKIPLPDPPFEELELAVYPPHELAEVISLIVRVEESRIAEVVSVARVAAVPELAAAGGTPFTAHLRDAEGAVLASGELVRLTTAACGGCGGCGGGGGGCGDGHGNPPSHYVAQVFLPDVAPGASLDITSGEDQVWRREAPSSPPRVTVAKPKVDRSGGVSLAWKASDGAQDFWVRWSADGEQWQSVAVEVTGAGVTLEPGRIPAGSGHLQVVAHDGFFSTTSQPVAVKVPRGSGGVSVLHPQDGHTYVAGQEVRLWASAVGSDPGDDEVEAVWRIGGKEVGRGLDTWAPLGVGEQRVTVDVGGAKAAVTVRGIELPRDDAPAG